jgi:hypothetical protein
MFTADKADWSYLAALFDGEGTFSVYRRTIDSAKYKAKSNDSGTSEAKPYLQYQSRIEVCNTNLKLMHWLIQNFGGVFYPHRRNNAIHKIGYYWRPKGKANNERIMLGVLPYLKIKRTQAILMLEYIRLDRAINPEKRAAIYAEMKILNRRGLPVTTNTLDCTESVQKIESELDSDIESAPDVNQGLDEDEVAMMRLGEPISEARIQYLNDLVAQSKAAEARI